MQVWKMERGTGSERVRAVLRQARMPGRAQQWWKKESRWEMVAQSGQTAPFHPGLQGQPWPSDNLNRASERGGFSQLTLHTLHNALGTSHQILHASKSLNTKMLLSSQLCLGGIQASTNDGGTWGDKYLGNHLKTCLCEDRILIISSKWTC